MKRKEHLFKDSRYKHRAVRTVVYLERKKQNDFLVQTIYLPTHLVQHTLTEPTILSQYDLYAASYIFISPVIIIYECKSSISFARLGPRPPKKCVEFVNSLLDFFSNCSVMLSKTICVSCFICRGCIVPLLLFLPKNSVTIIQRF